MIKYYDRKTKKIIEEQPNKLLTFLYNSIIGRVILKIITRPWVSKLNGIIINSSLSKVKIKSFIKKNNIDMSEYEMTKYYSFNDFFTRKIKTEKRPINYKDNTVISVADARLMAYKIDSNTIFKVKNSNYSINQLLQNDNLSQKYQDGYALVYRLTVSDYHHYLYPFDGKTINIKKISGILHTVNPIAFDTHQVFIENSREYSVLKSKEFKTVTYIEVGALNVGKINNYNLSVFKKGTEKGYFSFGGSTIILLYQKDTIKLDKDILKNSENNIETIVKYGEKIGLKKTH